MKIYALSRMHALDRKHTDIDTIGYYSREAPKYYRTVSGTIARKMAEVLTLMTDDNARAYGLVDDGEKSIALMREALREWMRIGRPLVVTEEVDAYQ